VRILVGDIDNLPHKVIIPRDSIEQNLELKLLFSGLSNQCNRCRAWGHLVKVFPLPKIRKQRKQGGTQNLVAH
jgi:hypothetical protein